MPHKQLTLENWTEADPVSTQFVRRGLTGFVSMDGRDWARYFLSEELKGHVPTEVRELFEVARGALLYGWFFYPLFHFGEDQLHRVREAAARACYTRLGGPRGRPTFDQTIEYLVARRLILEEERIYWDASRKLRNIGSHPEQQTVMPPGVVLGTLKRTAHDINLLFVRVGRFAASYDG
jgi:hypothetical protein